MMAAIQLLISIRDTFPRMEDRMFDATTQGSMAELLILLAIVCLTVVSTIDLVLHAEEHNKNNDQKR